MAVITKKRFLPEPIEHSTRTSRKVNVEHMEDTDHSDIHMSNVAPLTNGYTEMNKAGNAEAPSNVDGSESTTQHKTRRKFAVAPVETSTRSSKRREQDVETTALPKRRFAPEPIETTSKSSRNKENNQEEVKTSRPGRKFAAEPIETSMRSSKDRDEETHDFTNGARPKRRFAPQLVETDIQSSKDKQEENKQSKPRKKFAVEPVETSTSSSRKKREELTASSETPSRTSSGGRKFAPELVGTAKASFRKKDKVEPAVPAWLRAEIIDEGSWSAPEAEESRFSAKNLARKARKDPRRHSYNVPDLPMIQSDSSGEESVDQQFPDSPHHLHVHREKYVPGGGMSYRDYILNLRRDADMKTLREQAVAAYGSQEDRVPFQHYGGDSDDEDYSISVGQLSVKDNADPQLFRRMSHDDLQLKLADMRAHHNRLDEAKRDLEEDTAGVSRFSAAALAARHHLGIVHPDSYRTRREKTKALEEDDEFMKMKKAASPPMLGYDIKFPLSISPKMTRCDPDQAPRPRRANSEDEEDHDIGTLELWSAHVSVQHDAPTGLWGGLCQADSTRPTTPTTPLRSGIQTPMWEPNPFDGGTPRMTRTPGTKTPGTKTPGTKTPRRLQGLWGSVAHMPLTPPRSKHERGNDSFTSALDQKLALEAQIDAEFSPRVITQIYNYLSLGYPSIARPFDEELSKISRIAIVDLRKGDRSETGTLKGHVGAPEGEGDFVEDEDGRVRGCRRWEALRLYVREWARQSPNFASERIVPYATMGTGMWGNNAPVRKGSWGF
ncbi:hypothetical protein H2198_009914 [Neophaeococcomyces mojaviensis]|uniref:Uncharacterized protein n=1 Tax=Neophaeococcomyces mojaviensis TaxID=3383035 RepID=A0ACC2ZT82_9EURO|nr:hypothetical protein H2198_009914 [Knufia sp. JES_112]